MSETHNGNLNKSKIVATGVAGEKSVGKSNDPEASLRKGNMPKASAVTTVSKDVNKGKAIACATKQNTTDETIVLNVHPSGKERKYFTTAKAKGCE